MEKDKLIQEQFARLPTELQKALGVVKWKEMVAEIAKVNILNEENLENLERETMFILYGFESPEDYTSNLMRELSISEEMADIIAQEVDEKIFKVISEMIEKGEDKKEVALASLIPEIPPKILPAIEPGEGVHEVIKEVGSKEYGVGKEAREGKEEVRSLPSQGMEKEVRKETVPVKNLEFKKSEPTPAPVPPAPEKLPPTPVPPVAPAESKPKPPTSSAYPGGADPYREPIE